MTRVVCGWCKKSMGVKKGEGGATHGICLSCLEKTLGHPLPPDQWLLLASIEIDQRLEDDDESAGARFALMAAWEELQRLLGETRRAA